MMSITFTKWDVQYLDSRVVSTDDKPKTSTKFQDTRRTGAIVPSCVFFLPFGSASSSKLRRLLNNFFEFHASQWLSKGPHNLIERLQLPLLLVKMVCSEIEVLVLFKILLTGEKLKNEKFQKLELIVAPMFSRLWNVFEMFSSRCFKK